MAELKPLYKEIEYPGIPLTEEEIKDIRAMRAAYKNARWFRATVWTWMIWLTGVGTLVTVLTQVVKGFR